VARGGESQWHEGGSHSGTRGGVYMCGVMYIDDNIYFLVL